VHLYEVPLIFVLLGLALYVVLAGADFGAGVWQLSAGSGPGADRVREHAHDAIAPVWEANHVWLIFVVTVTWTAYPVAFGSIASTLTLPLFIAAIGIIFRGAAYALQSGTRAGRERRMIDTVFSVSSILTPFALGAAIGGIASRRVPVGNAAGHLFSSWLNPTSILIGALSVIVGAFLAAVYLSADAVRLGQPEIERWFRARALGSGVLAGGVAVAGLVVLHSDAHPLYHGLLSGDGRAGLIVSLVAGPLTLALVWLRRFTAARYAAALAGAAIIFGWALAQHPLFLRGLTVGQAAASHDTLVAVTVAVLAGGAILFPSLALLFGLVLGGRFDPSRAAAGATAEGAAPIRALGPGLLTRSAGACLVVGLGFLTVADAGWAHAVGVVALFGFIVLGVLAVSPAETAALDKDGA